MISRISPGKQATIPKKKANASLEHPLIRIPGAVKITAINVPILPVPATRANRKNADSEHPPIPIPGAARITATNAIILPAPATRVKTIWMNRKI